MANARGWLRASKKPGEADNGGLDYEQVARVAYELYERRGRTNGQDFDDWVAAEQIVKQRSIPFGGRRVKTA